MLQGESLICFAPEPWGSMWRSRQQIAVRFARQNTVLFVEPRTYLRSLIKGLANGQVEIGELRKGGTVRMSEALHVYRPPSYAPISGKRTVEVITGFLRTNGIRRAMRSLGMTRPILWLERPDMGNEIGKYGEKLLIYRVVDEYSAYNDVDDEGKLRVRQQEEYLLHRADMVLVTSASLLESKSVHNRHTYLLPHGVDYAAYATAAEDSRLPDDIGKLPRPLIGYSGLIGARLNLKLLADLALAHPNWTLVMVGQINPRGCEAELLGMRRIPNVHFLGHVDVGLVPHYVKAFDVGLIPYRLDEQSRNINPLKLLEYLACGKPVVSVDIPSVRPFADVVGIALSQDAFTCLVEEALAAGGGEAKRRRQAVAAQNTWENRLELFSRLVEDALTRKGR